MRQLLRVKFVQLIKRRIVTSFLCLNRAMCAFSIIVHTYIHIEMYICIRICSVPSFVVFQAYSASIAQAFMCLFAAAFQTLYLFFFACIYLGTSRRVFVCAFVDIVGIDGAASQQAKLFIVFLYYVLIVLDTPVRNFF